MPHCNKQMISFFLTTKCNLNCIYCYNSMERTEIKTLPLEIAKAGIDEYFLKNRSRHIRFYGPGEPTQEFNLMRQISDYAQERGGAIVTKELQTNGVFSSTVREWILNNIDIMWISFDGTPDIQNRQRPFPNKKPSSNKIEENIKWLYANQNEHKLMIGARVTMTDLNILQQKEMVDYFNGLGIKNIWTDPEFPSVDKIPVCNDKEKLSQFNFDMDKYVHNFIEAHRYAKQIGVFYGSFLMANFDGESKINCRACTPAPHFTPDGYISACDLVVSGAKAYHMDCFIYGKWNVNSQKLEYYPEKIKALQNRNIDSIDHCNNCIAKLHCGGYCLGEIQNETGRLNGQKPMVCKAIRTLYKELGLSNKFEYLHP